MHSHCARLPNQQPNSTHSVTIDFISVDLRLDKVTSAFRILKPKMYSTSTIFKIAAVVGVLSFHLAVRSGDHVDVVADQLEREASVHEGETSLQRERDIS